MPRTLTIADLLHGGPLFGDLFYAPWSPFRLSKTHAEGEYKATVFVDALQDAHINDFGTGLRKLRVRTKKIRGVRKDETDAFIRLADALCGFVRVVNHDDELRQLLETALRNGILTRL